VNAPDDEQFESYLRQFKPLAAGLLPGRNQERAIRFSRFARWAASAAVLLVTAGLTIYFSAGPHSSSGGTIKPVTVRPAETAGPLTLGEANALLSHSPSIKEAMNQVAFPAQSTQPQSIQPSQGKQSALAALSQETTKL
jgi:hypothetical protein